MNRLIEVIAFTPDLDGMRRFYEHGVGLATTFADPHWTSFDTAGAALALHPLEDGREREIELTFESLDLDGDLHRLRDRGIALGPVHDEPFGRFVEFRDPEGNYLSLRQGAYPTKEGRGPTIGTVILNCRNLANTAAFYRETMGLRVESESPHWIELEAGSARLALHLRPSGMDHPLHAAQKVAWCFDAPDLDTWVEEMRARGLTFATAPTEEEWGLYAEAIDPDGNVVVFRAPQEPATLEEELAEAFETGDTPHAEGMRKPVKKGQGGASRLALRPEYRAQKQKPAAKKSAVPKRRRAVVSPRGTGPAGTRKKPKTRTDVKRAKAKPATGRLKKAERRVAARKKSAVARASKGRPVKRASARGGRGGRGQR